MLFTAHLMITLGFVQPMPIYFLGSSGMAPAAQAS